MSTNKTATYRLRFFFDYHCGGCLWAGNDAAYEKYDVGTLDAEILNQEPKIKLPDAIRQKVLMLDELFCEHLDWDNPGDPSLWDKKQWESFLTKTKELHQEISEYLGDDFEVIYEQSDYSN